MAGEGKGDHESAALPANVSAPPINAEDGGAVPSASFRVRREQQVHSDETYRYAKLQRSIFTDWMRSIAIYLVVAAHVLVTICRTVDMDEYEEDLGHGSLMAYPRIYAARCRVGSRADCEESLAGSDYIYNPARAKIFSIFRCLLQSGMPAFMYFSGRSATFNRDRLLVFLYKKVMRLVVPLICAYFLVVVPTTYISCEWRPGMNRPEEGEDESACQQGFQAFFIWMVAGFKDGFSWLWFLPVLFILALANYPFNTWYQKRYFRNSQSFEPAHDLLYLTLILVEASVVVFGFHFGLSFTPHFCLLVVAPYVLNVCLLFSVHRIRRAKRFELMFLPQALASLLLARIHNAEMSELGGYIPRLVAAIIHYNCFYLQGFVDQVLDAEYLDFKQTKGHKVWRPFGLFFLLSLLAVTSPGTEYGVGPLWTYPLYSLWPLTVLYVAGTWIWLVIFIRWGQTFFQDYFDEGKTVYTHLTAASIVIYIVHWFFCDLLVLLVTRPAKLALPAAVFVLFLGTVALSLGTYLICRYVPYVGLIFGFVQPSKARTNREHVKKADEIDSAQSEEQPVAGPLPPVDSPAAAVVGAKDDLVVGVGTV